VDDRAMKRLLSFSRIQQPPFEAYFAAFQSHLNPCPLHYIVMAEEVANNASGDMPQIMLDSFYAPMQSVAAELDKLEFV
jgi:hypothetical protein